RSRRDRRRAARRRSARRPHRRVRDRLAARLPPALRRLTEAGLLGPSPPPAKRPGPPVDESDRQPRRQRGSGVVQRQLQTRDHARPPGLHRRTPGPADRTTPVSKIRGEAPTYTSALLELHFKVAEATA